MIATSKFTLARAHASGWSPHPRLPAARQSVLPCSFGRCRPSPSVRVAITKKFALDARSPLPTLPLLPAGAAGIGYGTLLGYVHSQPKHFMATAYGLNSMLVGGAVLGASVRRPPTPSVSPLSHSLARPTTRRRTPGRLRAPPQARHHGPAPDLRRLLCPDWHCRHGHRVCVGVWWGGRPTHALIPPFPSTVILSPHRLPLPLPLPAAAGMRRLPLGFAVWGASGYCGEHLVGQLAAWRDREARKIRAARGLAAGAGGAEASGAAVEAPALAALPSPSSLPVSEGGGTSPADADSGSTGGGGGPGFAAWLPISFSREANEEKRLERLKKRLYTVEEALGLRQPEGQGGGGTGRAEGQGGGGTSPGTR
jgi:hypothetical protein